MTSQSPPKEGALPPRDYVDAWMSIRILVSEGASWSGRELNHVFLNMGGGRFADVSAVSTADMIGDGRSLATIDWDDDGKLDFFLKNRTAPRLQFFRNQDGSDASFLSVGLTGVTSNRDAIGARVRVEAAGRVHTKTLHAGEGYLAQSSKRLHFGLGQADRVDRLTVRWPDGSTDVYEDLAVDTRYAITQGSSAPEVVAARKESELAALEARPLEGADADRARVALVEKIPLRAVRIPAFDDERRTVEGLAGRPALLNLWGTTCAACMKEFADFRERRSDIERAGLRIVPLVTDGSAEHGTARAMLAERGLEGGGYVDDDLRSVLQILFGELFDQFDEIPLPTSLLLDGAGNLVAVYPGRIELDELLRDVELVGKMNPKSLSDTRLTGGVRLLRRGRDYREIARKFDREGLKELGEFYRGFVRK